MNGKSQEDLNMDFAERLATHAAHIKEVAVRVDKVDHVIEVLVGEIKNIRIAVVVIALSILTNSTWLNAGLSILKHFFI